MAVTIRGASPASTRKRGREEMKATIGVDVGATTISGGLVTHEGDILHTLQMPTRGVGTGTVVERLLDVIAELLEGARSCGVLLAGVGVGVAGRRRSREGRDAARCRQRSPRAGPRSARAGHPTRHESAGLRRQRCQRPRPRRVDVRRGPGRPLARALRRRHACRRRSDHRRCPVPGLQGLRGGVPQLADQLRRPGLFLLRAWQSRRRRRGTGDRRGGPAAGRDRFRGRTAGARRRRSSNITSERVFQAAHQAIRSPRPSSTGRAMPSAQGSASSSMA